MRYRIKHKTQYFYGDSVPQCHNVLHLTPRQTKRQRLLSHSLSISPNPMLRNERVDFFGNPVTWFSLHEPHDKLTILARSEVEVADAAPATEIQSPPWEQAVEMLRQNREPDFLDARQFVFESNFVSLAPELADYARKCFPAGRNLLDGVTDLTKQIFADFTFNSRATTIGTPVLEILRHRHGVCQDFAHLEIGCLRSLGLAAAYVSGYLLTQPPPGRPRLLGADSSHAWVTVFIPGVGWIDFDPTNGLLPVNDHITLAIARDYDDISPVRGVVVGGGRHSLSVSVDVELVNGAAATAH